jgi:hypothetical protein
MLDSTTLEGTASLPPERWMAVVADPGQAAALEVALSASASPLLRWRHRHGLVQTVAPADLAPAVLAVLDGAPGELHLHGDLPLDAIEQALAGLTAAQANRVRYTRWASSFASLLSQLQEPDAWVMLGWLGSGRRRVPELWAGFLPADRRDGFLVEAGQAFAAWSQAFLEVHDTDWLDEVYGPDAEEGGSSDLLPQPHGQDASASPARPAAGLIVQRVAAHLPDAGNDTFVELAAASATEPATQTWHLLLGSEGRVDLTLPAHLQEWMSEVALKIEVGLSEPGVQAEPSLLLELHPVHGRPLLVHLAGQGSSRTAARTVTAEWAQALKNGGARLRRTASRPAS